MLLKRATADDFLAKCSLVRGNRYAVRRVNFVEREKIPLEQIISLARFAVTHAVGVWINESFIAMRAKRWTKEKFVEALKQVPDSEPPEYDRLPAGYVRQSQ